jgi:AcrR family transcriptional regulator
MSMAATKRKPLSRERILAAALALVDEQGIEALSMRRLGQALGFEAMSLYNHVASKDDLLDGILDLVLAEMEPPPPDGGLPAIRRSAVAAHEALQRHAWAAHLLMAPGRVRPARLDYMEALLACLRGAGFSADTTYHAYHVVDAHIVGFSLWQAGHAAAPAHVEDMREWFERMIPVDRFPHLHEHGLQHLDDGPHRAVSAFEFALDLLLASLEKLRETASA